MFMLVLIFNMSVNIHDSLLMDTDASKPNEVESLIELLMRSINKQWELPDTPDGIGEDQISHLAGSYKYTCAEETDLLTYFPQCQTLFFPELPNCYTGLRLRPASPPPILKA